MLHPRIRLLKMFQLNYFKNLKSPQIEKTINVDDYVKLIKNNKTSPELFHARKAGKGSVEYEKLKTQRPCITFNFLYNQYKTDANIIKSTGLLYFDIDKPLNITLDYNNIFIKHKSYGGLGTVLVVKVNGITKENFKSNYEHIAKQLGIDTYFDVNACKSTQFTVVSHDDDILYNPNCFVFNAISEKVSFTGELEGKKSIYPLNDTFLSGKNYQNTYRHTNASDYVCNGKDYQVFKDGIDVAKIVIPRNIPVGNRRNVLLAIINQIVSINPHISYDKALKHGIDMNYLITKTPLYQSEVVSIVKSVWKYKLAGTLKPINNKVRKVIFAANCKLTKEEKIGTVNKEIGGIRSDRTNHQIREAINDGNLSTKKITQETIAIAIGKSLITVKRHWTSEFKELLKSRNLTIKNELQSIRKNGQDLVIDNDTQKIDYHRVDEKCTVLPIFTKEDLRNYVNKIAPNRYNCQTIENRFELIKEVDEPFTHISICKAFLMEGYSNLN